MGQAAIDGRSSVGLRGRRWVTALIVVLAVAGVGRGAWWWTHPAVFGDSYGSFGAGSQPVGRATRVGLPGLERSGHHETITLLDYRVHFSQDAAAATGSLSVCVPRPGADDGVFGVGSRAELSRVCRVVRPVAAGTTLRLKGHADSDFLVLTVRADRAGTATVDDVSLHYRRGGDHLFQQGTQHIDGVDILTVRAT